MYYEAVKSEFKKILKEENITISDVFLETMLEVCSGICNYTEEDQRVRPQIVFGKNLHKILQVVNSKSIYIMKEDDFQGNHFARIFKSLALFCDNGWYIYINILDDKLEYGVFRMYTDIDGSSFEEFMLTNSNQFTSIRESSIVVIKAENNFMLSINRPEKEKVEISLKFVPTNIMNLDSEYTLMSEDITNVQQIDGANLKEEELQFVRNSMKKILRNLPMIVHGTIVLVVEENFEYPNRFLNGIQLSPKINFYKHFLENRRIGSYAEAEKFYAITGAFYEMLNNDGITVITKNGNVIGYNAFYEGEIPKEIKGGARKRTALGIFKNRELKFVCAVYFQSQDGDIMYMRRSQYE